MRLTLAPGVEIAARDVSLTYITAGGPGGQNVNKVATAAQLRFDLAGSEDFSAEVKRRMAHLAGSKCTQEGCIVITARRFRTQEQNREDAYARLAELIIAARHRQKRRIATRPGAAARARRVDAKTHRGAIKRDRGRVDDG